MRESPPPLGPGRIVPVRVTSFAIEEQTFSPLLYPQRRRFNRRPLFWAWVGTGMASMAFNLIYLNHMGIIHIRYGYYLWMAAMALIYLSFSPRLSGY